MCKCYLEIVSSVSVFSHTSLHILYSCRAHNSKLERCTEGCGCSYMCKSKRAKRYRSSLFFRLCILSIVQFFSSVSLALPLCGSLSRCCIAMVCLCIWQCAPFRLSSEWQYTWQSPYHPLGLLQRPVCLLLYYV